MTEAQLTVLAHNYHQRLCMDIPTCCRWRNVRSVRQFVLFGMQCPRTTSANVYHR